MAKNIEQLKDLALHAANGTAPADFSASKEEVNETLRQEIQLLAGDYNAYRRNKYDVFEIIQTVADVQVPKKVMDIMGQFAEIAVFKNGARPQFKLRRGRNRAKGFVTRAAASGVYRAFRLDSELIDVNTYANGIAAYIDFERFLTGDEDISESAAIITEALEDAIYVDIQKALRATINEASRPMANKVTDTAFNAKNLAKLCATVKAYGDGAVIFAPPEFVAEMATGNAITGSGIYPTISVNDIEDIRTKGYIGMFQGCPIVQLPQSFTDETNTHTVIDPQTAYVFPTGGEKIVKVAFEGNTIVKDWENRDNSMEIQAYRKYGVAILSYHNWGIYRNTGIASTYVEE